MTCITVYEQGEIVHSDLVPDSLAEEFVTAFENAGYEVRSEPA